MLGHVEGGLVINWAHPLLTGDHGRSTQGNEAAIVSFFGGTTLALPLTDPCVACGLLDEDCYICA